MAKEIAIGKRAKISEAQQYMLFSVLGAAIFLGAGVALVSHFIQQISFNAKIIAAEEQSIATYSNAIKTLGICKSPKGSVYSDDELKKCDPSSIEISQIPGTLRANILENLAANSALDSVTKEDKSDCINAEGKTYTYKELNQLYKEAVGAEALQVASNRIKNCSALRIIPDALPAFQNEEALLSSLNKLFITSGYNPAGFSAVDYSQSGLNEAFNNVHVSTVRFSFEDVNADAITTILHDIERSVRGFNVNKINLEFKDKNEDIKEVRFDFSASDVNAYYTDPSKLAETTQTLSPENQ